MIINNNIFHYFLNILRFGQKLLLPSLIASAPLSALGEVTLGSSDGWKFGVSGHIPVFALISQNDDLKEDAFRITTGFNPATIQFNTYAPPQNGLNISGHFQLNSHLAGADGVQNSGFGQVNAGRVSGVESRVAEMAISGGFGTINIGKGYGLFGVPAIGDSGSGLGVGIFSPNGGGSTAGHIGNGYFYANFNPRVIYASPNMNGAQFKIGLFQPEKPKDTANTAMNKLVGTETPRVEGNIVWSNDMLTLWSSSFIQRVNVDSAAAKNFTMLGADFGGALTAGNIDLRANYSYTQGTGNSVFGGHDVTGGMQEKSAKQWYVEAAYNMNKMQLGTSYGEGSDDLDNSDTSLAMVFLHYNATDALTLMTELQAFSNDTVNNDYNAFIVGAQFAF